MKIKSIYVIGSLRNPEIPLFAADLREAGFDVFDDWYSAGEHADDAWRDYEIARGRSYDEALKGYAAQHVFGFDKKHLLRCDAAVLVLPAGKSGHMELGFVLGKDKPGFIFMDKNPDRYDVMYNFATGVFFDKQKLIDVLLG